MQKRISAYFGPGGSAQPAKRAKRDASSSGSAAPAASAASATSAASAAPPPSSPAARLAANRAAALAKLAARRASGASGPKIPGFAALEPSWRAALAVTLAEPFWAQLAAFVDARRKEATVFPPANEVFSAFNHCPLGRVKVVVIGQDPYHGKGQAHGMSFSVGRGVAAPPSLRNIYKELEADIDGWKRPRHGHLEKWAKQGVLLLNSVLTVEEGKANSHAKRGWERFTDAVVQAVGRREGKGVVFLLWGNGAKVSLVLRNIVWRL